jgi:peptidoglycan/xylan/chitin deacetylase (PgdA/CDA1 family)
VLHSIAKVAVSLNLDAAANTVVERFSRRFQILGYHKISKDPHPFFEPVHPEIFEKHMQFLKSCYNVIHLQELVARAKRGDVPERAVAITFDDGYRDNYDCAFPILKKYQLPATIFVATGAIDTGNLIWHDRAFDAFRFATVSRARLEDRAVPELVLETDEGRRKSLESTLLRARRLYGDQRRVFIDDLEQKLRPNLPVCAGQRMLTWDQVREMHQAGIDFGSHTVSHTILSHVPKSDLVKELQDSKNEISERLGSPVVTFAYPNGKHSDYNDEAKAVLYECGYSCAVTSCSGSNHASSDVFELKRCLPWQKEIDVFRFKFFLQRHGLAS